MEKKRKLITAEEILRRQETQTDYEIAEAFGITPPAVTYNRRKFGIKRPCSSKFKLIYAHYLVCKNIGETAIGCNVSYPTVVRALRYYDVEKVRRLSKRGRPKRNETK